MNTWGESQNSGQGLLNVDKCRLSNLISVSLDGINIMKITVATYSEKDSDNGC